jgi:hypothetical protein
MSVIAARSILALALCVPVCSVARGEMTSWVEYPGGEGPGQGKHVVFLSGDEE